MCEGCVCDGDYVAVAVGYECQCDVLVRWDRSVVRRVKSQVQRPEFGIKIESTKSVIRGRLLGIWGRYGEGYVLDR